MPAYFTIEIECDKKKIYENSLSYLYKALTDNGFCFRQGYMDAEAMSLEEITDANSERFKRGYTPSAEDDAGKYYKQVIFDLEGFSCARMYILNWGDTESFAVNIVIPEDEVVEYAEDREVFPAKKLEHLIKAMKTIWNYSFVRSIQTGLEKEGGAATLREVVAGEKPSVSPFAILPRAAVSEASLAKYDCEELLNGVLLKSKKLR